MDKLVILLCLVGLVASGLIDGRLRQDTHIIQGQQHHDMQRLKAMTREELLCQKFLLDILQQVELPLQNHQLLDISTEGITNENLYIGPIDDDMSLMLKLIRTDKVLGRNSHCSMTNEKHLRQMLGLYRLLVRSRDSDTFKRLAVYARQNINPVLFVNAITLAVQDRVDTRNLIVPALHEILPRLFHDNDLIRQMQNLKLRGIADNDINRRRNILDTIGLGKQSQSTDLNVLDRSQLWKPWQEMHQQLSVQKTLNGHVVMRNQVGQDVIVLTSSEGIGHGKEQKSLVANDVGLKSFLNVLVDELILTQGIMRNSNEDNQIWQRSQIKDNTLLNRMGNGILNNRDQMWNVNQDQNNRNDDNIMSDNMSNEKQWRSNDIDRQLNSRMNKNGHGSIDNIVINRGGSQNRRIEMDSNVMERSNVDGQQRMLGLGLRGHSNWDDIVMNRGGSQTRGSQIISNVMGRNSMEDQVQTRGSSRWQNVRQDSNVIGRNNIDNHGRVVGWGLRGSQQNDQDRLMGLGIRGRQNSQQNDDLDNIEMNQDRSQTLGNSRWQDSNVMGRNNVDHQGRVVGWGLRDSQQNHDMDDINMNRGIDQIRRHQMSSNIMGRNNDNDKDRLMGLGIRGRMGQQNNDLDNMDMNQDRSQIWDSSRWQGHDSNLMGKNNIDHQGRVLGWGLRDSQQNDDLDDINMNKGINRIRRHQMNSNDDNESRTMGLGIRGRMGQQNYDLDNMEMNHSQNRGSSRWQNVGHDSNVMDKSNIDDQGQVVGWRLRGHKGQQNKDLEDSIMHQGRSQIRNTWQNLEQTSNIRHKKSIDVHEGMIDDARISTGHLLLEQLQQLVARLNIEDISLRKTDNLLDMPRNMGYQLSNRVVNPLLNNIGIDEHQRQVVLNKMDEITDRLDRTLQLATSRMSNLMHTDVRGRRVSQQLDHVLLIEILNEVLSLSDYVRDGQISSILENPTTRILLRHIVNTVDRQLQKLQKGRSDKEIILDSVKINDVHIDKLQTYVDYADVDLSNMMDSNIVGDNGKNIHTVIGRIPRLNHKPFGMNVDITSDRNQQVVVRVLLVPQGEALGNVHSMENQRQNVVLLDIAQIDLKVGRNQINCQSRDVSWTGRDSTLYTDIYKRVMGTLNDKINSMQDTVNVRNDLLPHRLLIPRGRVDGLPMQLVVVVTPAEQNIHGVQQQLQRTGRLGMDSLMLDNLPLTYPLDKDINDVNSLNSLPNIHMKPVLIYHNDQI